MNNWHFCNNAYYLSNINYQWTIGIHRCPTTKDLLEPLENKMLHKH